MTKVGVFKLVSFLVIVGLLIAVCTIEDRLVSDFLMKVKSFCYEIELASEEMAELRVEKLPLWWTIWRLLGKRMKVNFVSWSIINPLSNWVLRLSDLRHT